MRTPATAATALFAALAVALGYLLISVPNVELLSFTVFASGVILGRLRGALVGALAMAIYSALNPAGSGLGIPTLYVAQIAATAVIGMAGGVSAPLWRNGGGLSLALVSGGTGLVLTALYQSAVILGLAAASPEFRTGAMAVLVSNAFFSLVHLFSNTAIFAVLAPVVLPRAIGMFGTAVRRGGAGRWNGREG